LLLISDGVDILWPLGSGIEVSGDCNVAVVFIIILIRSGNDMGSEHHDKLVMSVFVKRVSLNVLGLP